MKSPGKHLGPAQLKLDLKVEKEVEIDGVGMGVGISSKDDYPRASRP